MMSLPILTTKLYIPTLRPNNVPRHRLVDQLSEGALRKLTLITAPAGYGKTTLLTEYLMRSMLPTAWLSLDGNDNDPARFLTYIYAALQTVGISTGTSMSIALQSPQHLSIEPVLIALLNELTSYEGNVVLVLDDYHVIESPAIDHIVTFILEHMPPQMHLVIATRENPRLPLSQLRVKNQLTELCAVDLRFSSSEAAEFLTRVMGLDLTPVQIRQLESRTEGWIAGLQLAGLSLQGHQNPRSFIESFSGNHHYVLDYLVEEVLKRQSPSIQGFLLRTSILDRFCGTLADAVLKGQSQEEAATLSSGQAALEYLENLNLFIVPLDSERRWYRYHHLFADLLRKRLQENAASLLGNEGSIAELHIRASIWYEEHNYAIDAFHHAAAAKDTQRAARLVEGEGMPLLFRGAVAPVLNWLNSLPDEELDREPALWVMYASALLMSGQMTEAELKLQAADNVLKGDEQNDKNRDLIGHIASIRATLAVSKHQADVIMTESRRALEFLHPNNLPVRTATAWTLGYAYQLLGNLSDARKAYAEALATSRKIGHIMIMILAELGLGSIQEAENQIDDGAEHYQRVLRMAGEPPLPIACEAHLGMARICYERNDLGSAESHGEMSVQLARQFEQTDRVAMGEVLLARIKLARGELSSAAAALSKADHFVRQNHFTHQIPQVAEAQVYVLLQQGKLEAAAQLANKHQLDLCLARVLITQGDTSAALSVLRRIQKQLEGKQLEYERLKVMILQAVALHTHGDKLRAVELISEAMMKAQPGGYVRVFTDEGMPMYRLIRDAAAHGMMPDYTSMLLTGFENEEIAGTVQLAPDLAQPGGFTLVDPLSARELEVLQLIAQGLSNQEISEKLFIAVTTVKGHNRIIFDKLQVKRRTEAVARARKLGLL